MYTSIISAKECAQNINDPDWCFVDCRFSIDDTERGERDYRSAHIPGAVYAHLNRDLSAPVLPGKTGRHPLPDIETLVALFSKWGIDGSVQVVAYDDATGGIAARLWWLLRYLGHERVAVLDGGWLAWQKQGLPTETRVRKRQPRSFVSHPQPHLLVSTPEVEQHFETSAHRLIDSRAADRFSGENETIDPVAGHIPTAENAPYEHNLDGEGRFRDKSELRHRFEAVLDGQSAEQTIFYCGSGVTACHNLLAMHHAGLGDGKLYLGSWSEWITDPARPIVAKS